jgi:hypothetical protein
VTLHSTPETLTPATATSAGSITYAFTVPSALPAGSHSVVLVGTTSAVTTTWTFSLVAPAVQGVTTTTTSSAASLPFTGSDTGRQLMIGIAALWSGLILLLWSRPRRFLLEVGGRHRATGGRHRQTDVRRPA